MREWAGHGEGTAKRPSKKQKKHQDKEHNDVQCYERVSRLSKIRRATQVLQMGSEQVCNCIPIL